MLYTCKLIYMLNNIKYISHQITGTNKSKMKSPPQTQLTLQKVVLPLSFQAEHSLATWPRHWGSIFPLHLYLSLTVTLNYNKKRRA